MTGLKLKDTEIDFLTIAALDDHIAGPITMPATMFHVIGDCNNCVEDVIYLLSRRQTQDESHKYATLFLGNYLAPNEHVLDMVDFLLDLVKSENNIILLRGYNESLLVSYLKGETLYGTQLSDCLKFVDVFSHALGFPFEEIEERFEALYLLLTETQTWYENQHYIFVPGYIDLTPSWKKTDIKDFFTQKNEMITQKNTTGKKVIFGHYPSPRLNASHFLNPSQKDFKMWHDIDFTKYCLNGLPSMDQSGKVLGLFIDDKDMYPISSRVGRKKLKLDYTTQ